MKTSLLLAGLPACLLALAPSALCASETPADAPVLAERGETAEAHDARMKWFRDARFGMFVHWGLYAQMAGEWKGKPANVNGCAEWGMFGRKIPVADYAAFAKEFNPVKFDANRWVAIAKDAGVRYIIITAKHHEGFAMFGSKVSRYNIVDSTPFRRDPLKELAEACRQQGVKLGFYYSQNIDWYHPGGGSAGWDPVQKGDSGKYVNDIVIPQVKELLSGYGDLAVLWWDIPGGVINRERASRIHKMVTDMKPNIILNNRLGGGYHSDIETPEQHIPASGFPGKDWESCMTMNDTWGFSKLDHKWKSPERLLENLCDVASKGGNYLLNVGPTPQGEIPAPSVERLAYLGAWLKVNGEAVYGTRAGIFPTLPSWGRVTVRRNPNGDSSLYAIVFKAPADGVIRFSGLTNPVSGVRVLGGGGAEAKSDPEGVTLTVPESLREKKYFVVALDLKGAAVLDTSVHADRDGVFTLTPRQATLSGGLKTRVPSFAGLGDTGEEAIANWTKKEGSASWTLKIPAAGDYAVSIRLGAPKPSAGSVLELSAGAASTTCVVVPTGNWQKYAPADAGRITLPAGEVTLKLGAKTINGEAPCDIAAITLKPVAK